MIDLKLAIRNAQRVLNRTNEQIRFQENEEKLASLSDHLLFADDDTLAIDLKAPTRDGQTRILLKEGLLIKGYDHRRHTKRKELHTFLFNDMVLFTVKSLSMRERFSGRSTTPVPGAFYVYKTVSQRNDCE